MNEIGQHSSSDGQGLRRKDTSEPRREDLRLITGQGQYVDDVSLGDAVHVTFVRSMAASGNILEVGTRVAAQASGVLAVFTGEDTSGIGVLPVNPVLPNIEVPGFPILAHRTVRSVGQPVAAVLARSSAAGTDAADLVEVSIDADQTVDRFEHSGRPAVSGRWTSGDVAGAFEHADHIVSAKIEHPRLAPCALEPRSVAAMFDGETGGLTVWLSTQTPHRSRETLATLLGIEIDRLRLVAPDVGGAFGMKASLYPEEVFVAWAALKLKRSVRWTASRNEEFLSASHGRGATTSGRLAVSSGGRFLALTAEVTCPLGHWLTNSAAIPAWNAARILPGPYLVESVDIGTAGVLSNTAPVGIYRGAGRPEAAALMERLVDKAAVATGLDPIEIRRRNLIESDAMPHQGPTGIVLDSGRYQMALDELLKLADYDGLKKAILDRREAGEIAGLGAAFFVEPCGQGWESARVEVLSDGTITAATGGSAQGQGRETAFAAIVAETFGVGQDMVTVLSGDSDTCPKGIGALASRSTAIGGSAILKAAQLAKDGLETNGPPASAEVVYETEGEAWGYGCHLAVVSIDPETGRLTVERIFVVDDIGNRLNPTMIEGQIVGGIAQGFGEAVLENIVYDENGQLITGSLTDYALPRATDVPAVTTAAIETPSPFNLLGAKGVGEAGTIGAPAAILNATHDALASSGVHDIQMPLTSDRIWSAINEAQKRMLAK